MTWVSFSFWAMPSPGQALYSGLMATGVHWNHEPHVARAAFDHLLANSTVTLLWGGHGANVAGVGKSPGGKQIMSLHTADGRSFGARAFARLSSLSIRTRLGARVTCTQYCKCDMCLRRDLGA